MTEKIMVCKKLNRKWGVTELNGFSRCFPRNIIWADRCIVKQSNSKEFWLIDFLKFGEMIDWGFKEKVPGIWTILNSFIFTAFCFRLLWFVFCQFTKCCIQYMTLDWNQKSWNLDILPRNENRSQLSDRSFFTS